MSSILNTRFVSLIVTVFMIILAVYTAIAVVPLGPTSLTAGSDETMVAYSTQTVDAAAGNITNLNITARTQTKHWQGYYGDISGTIVLDDAQNFTMYDWPNPEPKGEIYASVNATTPTWYSVICFNYTGGYGGQWNLTYWEDYYNMTWNDKDGIDETFNLTRHEAFDVGDIVTIQNSTCPSTFVHQSDAWQDVNFAQVLLMDSNGYLIFTTIIENDIESVNDDIQGYKTTGGFTPDFQMLVAEDGTSRTGPGGSINTFNTPYYFYVDLE